MEDEGGRVCGITHHTHTHTHICVEGLVEKPEGKRPRGRCRHRWEYNIKTYLKEMG